MSLPPDPVVAHQACQGLHFGDFLDRHLPKVSGRESHKVFSWREPLQVLVGSDVVVEDSEFIKRALQCIAAGDDQLPEQWLERAEQTLDPAVLPRRVLLGGLVVDTFGSGLDPGRCTPAGPCSC